MPVGSRLYLSWWDFSGYLSDFEDLVHDGEFHKMDYHMWRKLNYNRKDDPEVIIEKCGDSFIVIIGHEGEYHRFYRGDDSFGDFLFENLIDVKDGEYDWEVYKKPPIAMESAKNVAIDCGEALKASVAIAKDKLVDVGIKSNASSSLSCVVDSKVDRAEFDALSEKVQAFVDKNNNNDEKENSIMKGFNFDFGPMNGNVVRMSIYGLAVKNKTGNWVAYDAKNGEIMDVDVFNFDGSKFMYRMPAAINDVAVGDVIVHMSVPMFIVGKSEDGKAVYAVDPVAGERKEIMLTKSPFMFNFVTKVVNLLGDITATADSNNPFGNLLPLLLMEDKDNNDMFMAIMLMNNGNKDMSNMNPMVLYALTNKDKDFNILPFMLMNNMMISNQNQCHCKGNCN